MSVVKTREAAEMLGVSQTTIKRWASTYPHSFYKDPNGHYLFSDEGLERLVHIKEQIDKGKTMDQIELPSLGMSQAQPMPQAQPHSAQPQAQPMPQAQPHSAQPMPQSPSTLQQQPSQQLHHPSAQPQQQAAKLEAAASREETSPPPSNGEVEELMARIRQMELLIDQKANEVVSMQVLQHRKELDEIRKTVEQIAACIETLQGQQPMMPQAEAAGQNSGLDTRARKRGFFRIFQ
ncbi:MerR family transcriptional regulator [Paenibacillus sp. GCM10023252]|uniref:MerR family transcriptional regulator n=1 Tax=Paenibacillus sp. GCM10023252 TaxID=3252649 RepID=UPI0036084E0F